MYTLKNSILVWRLYYLLMKFVFVLIIKLAEAIVFE